MKSARETLEVPLFPLEFATPCKLRSVTTLKETCNINNLNTRKHDTHASLMHSNLPESALKRLNKRL